VIEDAGQALGYALQAGLELVVIGKTEGQLGQSLWLREVLGQEAGAPPVVDLTAERKNGDFVRAQILDGKVVACHDVSDGGLLVAIAEMALAGNVGASINTLKKHDFWFGEDQARYVLAVPDAGALLAAAEGQGVPAEHIGSATGDGLTLPGGFSISLQTLRDAHEGFFPNWFA
jgi:phosphoribosylformylglycinamidine synthase